MIFRHRLRSHCNSHELLELLVFSGGLVSAAFFVVEAGAGVGLDAIRFATDGVFAAGSCDLAELLQPAIAIANSIAPTIIRSCFNQIYEKLIIDKDTSLGFHILKMQSIQTPTILDEICAVGTFAYHNVFLTSLGV
ncbi:hypothetical protein [Nostoc sphaeroides]|uniref:hypothetical protein n=1 Tax=Nostoc sphaeroides TaxID=446679 RepID=UPI0012699D47|nr:hypothetical protein [Nostoc sphaeroides]